MSLNKRELIPILVLILSVMSALRLLSIIVSTSSSSHGLSGLSPDPQYRRFALNAPETGSSKKPTRPPSVTALTKKEFKVLTVFGYFCWEIWGDRCKKIFGEEGNGLQDNGLSAFFRASWDQSLLYRCKFYSGQQIKIHEECIGRSEAIRLEVDGSVLVTGRSGCGGVIRGENDRWLGGFSCKLTRVPPAIAELIAVIHGLQICWNRGYKSIVVNLDCIEAINLASRGCNNNHPFKDLVGMARLILSRNWDVVLKHVPRETNTLADGFAHLAHNLMGNFCYFDNPPSNFLEGMGEKNTQSSLSLM